MKIYHIVLAQKITYGYFYRVKIVCIMLIFSITIFLGLQILYRSVRQAGYNVVQNNIKYSGVVVWDEMQNQNKNIENVFCGIRFKTQTSTGTNIFISGINEQYVHEYENINLVDMNQDKWLELLKDTTGNWIILPEFYITSADIGNDMNVKIGDVEITFKILGGCYSNDFSKLNCYVNSTYLKKQLNLTNEYNIAYVKDSLTDYRDFFDIADESVHKAVGGTEVIEMIAIIIIICASISLINFLVMTGSSNNKDIARFRTMGIGSKDILFIYILHSLVPIIFTAIWIIPFSTLLGKIACNIMLASEYFSGGYIKVPILTVTILLSVALLSMITELIIVQKAACRKEYINLVKNDNYI